MADITIAFPEFSAQQKRRFWKLVDRSTGQGPAGKCWEWKGSRGRGYGKFYCQALFGKKQPRAHRIAFFLTTGIDPQIQVLHRCDNPPCCNPDHLWLGTQIENINDMRAKGRGRSKMIGPPKPNKLRAWYGKYYPKKNSPKKKMRKVREPRPKPARSILRPKKGPAITADPARYETISKHKTGIGEQHRNAKLTKEQVLAIRYFHDVLGVGRGVLARQYGVHRASIRDIVWRRSWAHI